MQDVLCNETLYIKGNRKINAWNNVLKQVCKKNPFMFLFTVKVEDKNVLF